MTFTPCTKCGGEGYVKDPDILADEGDEVECPECQGFGYIEKIPF